MGYKSNNNIVYDCTYHVVWCTKYRRSVLDLLVEQRLKEIALEVAEERQATIHEMEADGDHFHVLVSVDPQYGIHRLIKQIKGRSSKALRQEFPYLKSRLPTLWTNSYYVATAGGAPLEQIKTYIAGQKGK